MTQNPNLAVATVDNARQFLLSTSVQQTLKDGLQKHMSPDRTCRLVLTAVQKTQRLLECFATPQGKRSVGLCMLTAGQVGLGLNGRDAHIVPFKNKGGWMDAVFVPDYKGLVKLAYNHPKVLAIWGDVICENDSYNYIKGDSPKLDHRIDLTRPRGVMLAAYACAKLEGGGLVTEVVPADEIAKIKAASRGSDQPDSPWNKWESAMWIKSAIKRLSKLIPQSIELQRALAVEDEFEDTGSVKNSLTIDVQAEPEVRMGSKPQVEAPTTVEAQPAPAPEPQVPVQTGQPADASTPTRGKQAKTETPAENQPEQTEPSVGDRLRLYFAPATWEQVRTTLKRMNPNCTWLEKVSSWEDFNLPENSKRADSVWKPRVGILAEVKRDLTQ